MSGCTSIFFVVIFLCGLADRDIHQGIFEILTGNLMRVTCQCHTSDGATPQAYSDVQYQVLWCCWAHIVWDAFRSLDWIWVSVHSATGLPRTRLHRKRARCPAWLHPLKQNRIYWVGFYVPLVQYVHISRLKLSTWSFEFIKLLPRSFVLFAVRLFYGESSRIWTSCGQCRPPPFHSSNNPVVLLKSGRHILLRARSIVSKIPTDHRCMHAKGC